MTSFIKVNLPHNNHPGVMRLFVFFLSVPASEDRDMVAMEVERMLRLAEQCLERAKSFIGKNADHPDLSASVSTSTSCSPGQSEPQTATTASSTGEYTPFQSLSYHAITANLEPAPGVTNLN